MQVGDLLFLRQLWVEYNDADAAGSGTELLLVLIVVSTLSMIANFIGRVDVVQRTRGRRWENVSQSQRLEFIRGAIVFLVLPRVGMRLMRKTLADKTSTGMQWDASSNEFVELRRDPIATSAKTELVAARAEVRAAMILVGTEDIFEGIVLLIYFVFVAQLDAFDGNAFVFSLIGTFLHFLEHSTQAYMTWRSLE
eukprot:SAG31_NODE_9588_length_1254_cov_1.375758_2_plen_194_part_01